MRLTNDEIKTLIADLPNNHAAKRAADLLLALKARAEAVEKEAEEFRRALDRGATMETISVEARSEINHWKARAEAAEKERDRLRLVLERISNAKPHLKDLVRAALEAKP